MLSKWVIGDQQLAEQSIYLVTPIQEKSTVIAALIFEMDYSNSIAPILKVGQWKFGDAFLFNQEAEILSKIRLSNSEAALQIEKILAGKEKLRLVRTKGWLKVQVYRRTLSLIRFNPVSKTSISAKNNQQDPRARPNSHAL